VRGVVREVVVEPENGHEVVEHADHADDGGPLVLVTDDGDVVPLDADLGETPVTEARTVARLVEGPELDAARAGEQTEPVPVAQARFAQASAAASSGPHRVWVAVVDNSGPAMESNEVLQQRVQGGLDWWTTESGTTFEQVETRRFDSTIEDPSTRCGLQDTGPLWSEASKQFPDVFEDGQVRPREHLLVLVAGTCNGPAGIAMLGGGFQSGGFITMTQRKDVFTRVFTHEMGHNLSLHHANIGTREYGDLYSVMGLGADGVATALDSEYRDQLGLTVRGEVATVSASAGATRTLAPRGASSGLRGIELRRKGFSYWVEWRSGTDRDQRAYYTRGITTTADGTRYPIFEGVEYPPGVTISRMATGELPNGTLRYSYLLPRSADGTSKGSWQPGQTFTASGVTVKVSKVTSTGATVTVSNIAPLTASTPKVSGTPKVGRRLSVKRGTWTSGTSFSYRWLANGRAVKGATRSTFVVPRSLKGKRISVRLTGRKSGYTTVTRTSARTSTVR
jgi:hypothetical protein